MTPDYPEDICRSLVRLRGVKRLPIIKASKNIRRLGSTRHVYTGPQEARGRNPDSGTRAQLRAAQGVEARAGVRRSERKRRVHYGQAAPTVCECPDRSAQAATGRPFPY